MNGNYIWHLSSFSSLVVIFWCKLDLNKRPPFSNIAPKQRPPMFSEPPPRCWTTVDDEGLIGGGVDSCLSQSIVHREWRRVHFKLNMLVVLGCFTVNHSLNVYYFYLVFIFMLAYVSIFVYYLWLGWLQIIKHRSIHHLIYKEI